MNKALTYVTLVVLVVVSLQTPARDDAATYPPVRILAQGGSHCDADENCADGVVNVPCGVDAGHDMYQNPDFDATDVTRDLLAPFSRR